jgi:proline iminopeptidase
MKKFLLIFWVIICPATLLAQRKYEIHSHHNITLSVNEYGKGKTVILLAGGPGFNANYLKPIWEHLPNYRFVVPDQRGTGLSRLSKIDSANMSVDSYVEDLELLRRYLKLNKIVLAGHSWGGMLAASYAAKYPQNVERLILLGSGGITQNFFTYFNNNITMRLRECDLSEARGAGSFALRLRAIWPGYFYSRDSALSTKSLVDTNLADHNASKINSLTLGGYIKTGQSRALMIRKYKRPVYLIQGRQDPVGESTVFETKDILPQSQIFFIEKCGHLPWLEHSTATKRFYEILNAALK